MARMRTARKGDLDSLLALMEQHYAYDRHHFEERAARKAMRRLLDDSDLGTVLLITDKAPIEYLVLAFGYSLEFHGRDAFVDEFFLLEKYRGKGIGTAALAYAEQIEKKRGIKALHLEVTRHNNRVVGLYRRKGLVDHDRYLMTKLLA